MPKTTRASAQYIALTLFFAFAATYQTRFLIDLWRDFTFQYRLRRSRSVRRGPRSSRSSSARRRRDYDRATGSMRLMVDSVDGSSDLIRPIRLKRPGDTIEVIAEREGIERRVVIPLTSVRSKRISATVYTHAALMHVVMPAFCLLLGFGVAAIRPRDPMAWLLLILLVSVSQNSLSNVSVSGWPQWLRIPSHVYRALGTFSPACMLLFGIYFTSRWRVDIRLPWIKWLVIVPVTGMTLFTMVMQIGISECLSHGCTAGRPLFTKTASRQCSRTSRHRLVLCDYRVEERRCPLGQGCPPPASSAVVGVGGESHSAIVSHNFHTHLWLSGQPLVGGPDHADPPVPGDDGARHRGASSHGRARGHPPRGPVCLRAKWRTAFCRSSCPRRS